MSKEPTQINPMTTYDIESQYQDQIAPLEKKLARLKKSHETKSLRLHKGFLTKEKKAKNKLNKLDTTIEKSTSKLNSERATKIEQLEKVDQKIKKDQNNDIKSLKEQANNKIATFKDEIDQIRDELHVEHSELHEEYMENVHVYQEKLSSYEKLSKDKEKLYRKTYQDHIKALDKEFDDVISFTKDLQKSLDQSKKSFLKDIEKHINQSSKDQSKAKAEASKTHKKLSKNNNNYFSEIEDFIDQIKASYVDHYQPMLQGIKEREILIKDDYQTTIKNLQKDVDFRTEDTDSTIENNSKTTLKKQQKRRQLFNDRMALYSQIEETIKDRKLALLSFEHTNLRKIMDQELINLDKLEVFMKKDYDEVKDYTSQVHSMETSLFGQMDTIHQTLHEQSSKSTSMLTSFIEEFNKQMLTFQQSIISMIKNHLEQLHDKNIEIDRLDKEIDLAEPQKEIALNDFEENLALEDIKNRYQIKILNKEHQIHLIERQLNKDITVTKMQYQQKHLENDLQIDTTTMKYDTKISIEEAKYKAAKAKESFHLRENSLKHDEKQALLSLETNISKLEIKKEQTPYDIEKQHMLSQKETVQTIEQLQERFDLQDHMISQKYQEQIKSYDQQISRLKKQKAQLQDQYKQREENIKKDFDTKRASVIKTHKERLGKLQEALVRELKTPENNLEKWESYQDKTTLQLDKVLSHFDQEFNEVLEQYESYDTLSTLKQQFSDDEFITITTNTVFGLYEAYIKTVETLFTITKETLEDEVSMNIDTSVQKKLAKDLERRIKDFEKELQTIKKARDQQVKSYVIFLNDALNKLHKQKFSDASSFLETVQHIFSDTKESLTSLKGELIKEINYLFDPITQEDKELIRKAKENLSKAKSKLEEERQNQIRPIDISEQEVMSELHEELANEQESLLTQIDELEEKETFVLETQDKEIDRLRAQHEQELKPHQEYLKKLDEQSDQKEVLALEELDQKLTQLSQKDDQIKQNFEEKIQEAKSILEYEEKIESSTIDQAKEKEQSYITQKTDKFEEKTEELKQQIDQADDILEQEISDLHEKLYFDTSLLSHKNDLSKPEIQKQMQELKVEYEKQETLHADALIESKKIIRHIIESFDQQMRIEYNEFFDQLNQTIERMKVSYSKTIHEEVQIFNQLHSTIFTSVESSYEDMLKSIKKHTLDLSQKLHRLNKNLS